MAKHHTKETREKISKALKGNKNRKNIPFSEQGLQNKSNINKDKKIYNNGERNVFLRIGQEIPDGFVEGFLITKEDRERRHNQMVKLNNEKWNKWRLENGKQCSNTEPDN
jgi:hypothetical protein